jgi:hypothetical protein
MVFSAGAAAAVAVARDTHLPVAIRVAVGLELIPELLREPQVAGVSGMFS